MNKSKNIDVAIVGVQKAATSSIHRYMAQHPEFITHEPLEFAFFVRDEEFLAGYEKGYHRYFTEYNPAKKILVKNVGLIYWEDAMQRLAEHNPDIKIIAVLRNPVDRAYSAYHYAVYRGYEDKTTFEEALDADYKRFSDKIRSGTIDYYGRGDYAHQIKNLYKYFKKENVKIILQEEMKGNMEKILKECYILSGVDESFKPNLKIRYNESAKAKFPIISRLIINKNALKKLFKKFLPERFILNTKQKVKEFNRESFTPPPMKEETRKKLIEFYKPYNEELGRLLGRDFSGWNK